MADAIQQGRHLLQEVSIQFTCTFPPSKIDDFENQFLPGGMHYKYLSWLDQLIPPICNPYPNRLAEREQSYNIFDRNQRGVKPPSAADLKPKDDDTQHNQQQNQTEAFYFKALSRLVGAIVENIENMINLKLLAFYNLNFERLLGEHRLGDLLDGITKISREQFLFEGLVFKNCVLGECAKLVFRAVKDCRSVRLLALVQAGVPEDSGSDLQDAILAHKNYRDDKIWEKALKNERITFSRQRNASVSRGGSKKTAKKTNDERRVRSVLPTVTIQRPNSPTEAQRDKKPLKQYLRERDAEARHTSAMRQLEFTQEELLKFRIRAELKGLSYLDLSYNGLCNGFCEELCAALSDDTYIHSLELTGNEFDLKTKTLRLGQLLIEPNYGEDVDWSKIETTQPLTSHATNQPRLKQQQDLARRLSGTKRPPEVKNSGIVVPHSMEQVISRPIQRTSNNQIYLPIEIAIQKDIIEKLDHFQTLDNFQKFILEHIKPNYMSESNNRLTTVQLMQNYCSSAAELEELTELHAHPLVELLLNNCYIIYLSLDERTNYALQKFVQLRLRLNKQCMQEVLMNYCGRKLTEIEQEEVEIAMQQNLQNIEAIASKLSEGKSVSQIKPQNRSVVVYKQMQEQYGKEVVQDLIKQHDKKNAEDRRRNEQKTKEEVINEIRDGINQKKYIIKGVNEHVEEERVQRRPGSTTRAVARDKKGTPRKGPRSASSRPAGRHSQVKTFKSIKSMEARTGRTKSQQQRRVTRVLSQPRQRPPREEVALEDPQVVRDQNRINELLREIEGQRDEIRRLKARVQAESKRRLEAEKDSLAAARGRPAASPAAGTGKRAKTAASESEALFDAVLDQAYKILMEGAGGDRRAAIDLFNRHQAVILDCCEDAMNLVKKGALQQSALAEHLRRYMVFE